MTLKKKNSSPELGSWIFDLATYLVLVSTGSMLTLNLSLEKWGMFTVSALTGIALIVVNTLRNRAKDNLIHSLRSLVDWHEKEHLHLMNVATEALVVVKNLKDNKGMDGLKTAFMRYGKAVPDYQSMIRQHMENEQK